MRLKSQLRTLSVLVHGMALVAIAAFLAYRPTGADADAVKAPMSRADAIQRAAQHMTTLVTAKTLDSSWKQQAFVQSAEVVTLEAQKRWVIVFINESAVDPSPRRLVIVLSDQGVPITHRIVKDDP